MNIAIFGSSGFIGKNLVEYLTSVSQVQEVSLRKDSWENSIDDSVVIFINLVGKAHDHQSQATESDYYFSNVELTKQIFDVFKHSDAKLFIHISSIAAIEEYKSLKTLTETDECRPVSFYGKSKREAEKWLLQQEVQKEKKIIIIRPPMVHGVGDKGNLGLLHKLIIRGIPYPLSSFDNSRSFISMDNFSFLLGQIIEKQESLSSGIYHFADDETISTSEIIDIIALVEGKKAAKFRIPKNVMISIAKIGDILRLPLNTKRLTKMTSDLEVSNTKIKEALKIEKLPLSATDGLKQTILSFKKNKL